VLKLGYETSQKVTSEKEAFMKLTHFERWMLSNQFMILAKLYPEMKDSYEKMAEIVENGYEQHYDWISQYIYKGDDITTMEQSEEVRDILSMFEQLKYSYDDLNDKSDVDSFHIQFQGFSGNTETKHLAYTRFLIERENSFADLHRGDNFNSHAPMLDRYRKMVQQWKKSSNQYQLTKDDLIRITSI
jgi:uncharacterized protein